MHGENLYEKLSKQKRISIGLIFKKQLNANMFSLILKNIGDFKMLNGEIL